jgi:uncharacterized membrane protein
MPKKEGSRIGGWAFLIGVILAAILGAFGTVDKTMAIILVVLGLIVGLLNVTGKEIMPFLLAGTVLVIVSALGGGVLSNIIWLKNILDAILVLFVPATIIVALKTVFTIARR